MKRLMVIAAFAVALGVSTPAGACAASADDPCFHDPMVATVTGEMWWDYNGNGVHDADEHPGYLNPGEVWADYNHDGARQEGETLVDTERDGTYRLPVDTRKLAAGVHQVDVRFRFTRYPTLEDKFAPSCVAPAPGCLRTVDVTAEQTTPDVTFPAVGVGQLNGIVYDDKNANGRREAGEDGVAGVRAFIDDNGNGQSDPGEPTTYKTLPDGGYILPIPTRYQIAGGQLPPVVIDEPTGADCTGATDCALTGLVSRSGKVTLAEHGLARPVVIFLHGYGGSRISCPEKNLWFNLGTFGPDLMNMRLGADGENLRAADGGTDCSENAHVDGLVMDVGGGDIYGSSSKHFDAITWPGRHYDYVWDWRKDPKLAVAGLDAMVDEARAKFGVSQVVLVGHSMGGLVMRHYIETPSQAAKVARMVTVGTPYMGSPKTILPLAAGIEVPWFSKMDAFMSTLGLKLASRSFPGHFSLVPAFGYGPWLTVDHQRLDMDGVKDYLRRIGVNPDIYTRAAAEHGRVLDHYEDHGVPYEVIVGGGVPTIGAIAINYGAIDDLEVTWVSGDKTVPKFSAAMDTPRDRLHVVCGLEHVPITSDPQTTRLMDDYLIRAVPMRDAQADCDWTAHELTIFHPDQLTPVASASQARAPRVFSAGRAYTLAEAEKADLIQLITFGGSTKVVADGASDVRVELPAGSAIALRDLSPKGAGPQRRLTGAMTLDLDAGTVRGGKKAAKDTTPPRTTAKFRQGKLVLQARGAVASYVIAKGKTRRYTKPVKLKGSAKYFSVDAWGNAERPRPIRSRT